MTLRASFRIEATQRTGRKHWLFSIRTRATHDFAMHLIRDGERNCVQSSQSVMKSLHAVTSTAVVWRCMYSAPHHSSFVVATIDWLFRCALAHTLYCITDTTNCGWMGAANNRATLQSHRIQRQIGNQHQQICITNNDWVIAFHPFRLPRAIASLHANAFRKLAKWQNRFGFFYIFIEPIVGRCTIRRLCCCGLLGVFFSHFLRRVPMRCLQNKPLIWLECQLMR